MHLRKACRYRLDPTNTQAARLQWVLDRSRALYNAALQERRDAYQMAGVTVSYYEQKRELPGVKEECPEYREIGSQVLQDVASASAAESHRLCRGSVNGSVCAGR